MIYNFILIYFNNGIKNINLILIFLILICFIDKILFIYIYYNYFIRFCEISFHNYIIISITKLFLKNIIYKISINTS